ncbi:MAG: hypothetical protein QXY39_04470 [Thermofilaceae archaeon]
MELEQWLKVYQAASLVVSVKERIYWAVHGVGLLANLLLLLVLVNTGGLILGFMGGFGSVPVGTRALDTGLTVLGMMLSFSWLVLANRASKELALWAGLLRQVEGEFAGAEFQRAELRLLKGQPVRTLTTTALYNEWYPEIVRLSWLSRAFSRVFATALPACFLSGWLILSLLPWTLA